MRVAQLIGLPEFEYLKNLVLFETYGEELRRQLLINDIANDFDLTDEQRTKAVQLILPAEEHAQLKWLAQQSNTTMQAL